MLDPNSRYIVVTHNRVYGIPNALRDFLNARQVRDNLFIAHPLDGIGGDSFLENYHQGRIKSSWRIRRSPRLLFLNFFLDTILTLFWVFKQTGSYDLYIGADNLNALTGLILKKLGKVQKVVYYAMDFSPNRLKSTFLNWIYHTIEKFCVIHADEVWNTSLGISLGREKYLHLDRNKFTQKLVPTGIWPGIVQRKNFNQIKKNQLFFIGHLLEKQGVQIVLEAIPDIIKRIKDFKFIVVGSGEYEDELKKITKKLKIEHHVEFTGAIADHEEVHRLMGDSAVGIAPYKPDKEQVNNFTYYGDPGKIKDYINMGLPVILTDVSHNAKYLEEKECAIVISYSKQSVAKAVLKLMTDMEMLKRYRRNALKQAERYDWNKIFTEAFK